MTSRYGVPFLAAILLSLAALAADPPHVHPIAVASDDGAATPAHQPHPVDPNAPTPRGASVTLHVGGEQSAAYLARPKGTPLGGILVIHEWWGLNDWVKSRADAFADAGYLALAVDLYNGHVATTPDDAQKTMAVLSPTHTLKVESAGVAFLKKELKGKKIATIGWCMGGGQSLKASLANAAEVDATVMYYGMPEMDPAKLAVLRGPVLGLFAKKDGWITPAKVAEFDTALTKAKIPHELHEYDADHAFANPTGGAYNPPAAKDADGKTAAFLAKALK